MKTFLFSLIAILGFAPNVLGDAYFQTEFELVNNASVIAIIEIAEPIPSEQKGTHWTYRQTATAKVQSHIKGKIPDTFAVFGSEDFICAQCHLKTGRFLAFLKKDNELWTGSNWQLSLRPIKDDRIEWFATPEQSFPMTFQSSDIVLKRVKDIIDGTVKPVR